MPTMVRPRRGASTASPTGTPTPSATRGSPAARFTRKFVLSRGPHWRLDPPIISLTISSSLLGWLAGRNLLIDRGASRVVEKRFRTTGGFPHTTLARAHVALNRSKIRRTRTPRRPRVCADVTTAARRRRDEDGRETHSHRRPRYPADNSADDQRVVADLLSVLLGSPRVHHRPVLVRRRARRR